MIKNILLTSVQAFLIGMLAQRSGMGQIEAMLFTLLVIVIGDMKTFPLKEKETK